jgi:hypothetical protein
MRLNSLLPKSVSADCSHLSLYEHKHTAVTVSPHSLPTFASTLKSTTCQKLPSSPEHRILLLNAQAQLSESPFPFMLLHTIALGSE